MDKYLEDKFKGKYRILCHYDTETMDFPRDIHGNLESSIADFFIKCQNHVEIKHGKGKELYVYCPSKVRGVNMLKQIYQDKVSPKLPNDDDNKYSEHLCEELENKNVLFDISVLDVDVMFGFLIDMMDYMETIVKPVTSGASINALSAKNLPKKKYDIPEEDLKQYNKLIEVIPKTTVTIEGKERTMVNGLIIKQLVAKFDNTIQKVKCKGFDINADRKKRGIKGRDYINAIGLWQEFIDYLEEEVKQYE